MAMPLAGSPAQANAITNLNPSANLGGFNSVSPISTPRTDSSIGGSGNPFLPAPASGHTMPPMTASPATVSFPANTGGVAAPGGGVGPQAPTDINTLLGMPNIGPGTPGGKALWKGFINMGYPAGVATLLQTFLAGGAGYNPAVAKNLIASLQPSISRGEADIMEQFGSKGLADSSAAAIGFGDYLSQVDLNIGEILSGLYEQSIQNYLSVLLGSTSGRNEHKKPGALQQIQQILGDASAGLASPALIPGL
jgi:hypothetical protein